MTRIVLVALMVPGLLTSLVNLWDAVQEGAVRVTSAILLSLFAVLFVLLSVVSAYARWRETRGD